MTVTIYTCITYTYTICTYYIIRLPDYTFLLLYLVMLMLLDILLECYVILSDILVEVCYYRVICYTVIC
jgi:hypothetical protein